mmetsp:Transcript_83621/g.174902  ORF Transcript_83621/g.174902 Transcript_83621/m.174902 type:complete len:292 (+) Transcript_83621:648-1523(+)
MLESKTIPGNSNGHHLQVVFKRSCGELESLGVRGHCSHDALLVPPKRLGAILESHPIGPKCWEDEVSIAFQILRDVGQQSAVLVNSCFCNLALVSKRFTGDVECPATATTNGSKDHLAVMSRTISSELQSLSIRLDRCKHNLPILLQLLRCMFQRPAVALYSSQDDLLVIFQLLGRELKGPTVTLTNCKKNQLTVAPKGFWSTLESFAICLEKGQHKLPVSLANLRDVIGRPSKEDFLVSPQAGLCLANRIPVHYNGSAVCLAACCDDLRHRCEIFPLSFDVLQRHRQLLA